MIRVETYPYARTAFREGIYNALMHKAYESGNPIQIRIEEEGLYISNNIGNGLNLNPTYLLGKHESNPYNNLIAQTFYRAGYVEAWGRGINKMCKAALEWGCPMPEYITTDQVVRLFFRPIPPMHSEERVKNDTQTVEISNHPVEKSNQAADISNQAVEKSSQVADISNQDVEKKAENNEKDGENQGEAVEKTTEHVVENGLSSVENQGKSVENQKKSVEKTPKSKEKVIMYLNLHPEATQTDLMKETGLTRRGIEYIISCLKQEGLLERKGSDRKGLWIVKK